MSTAAGVGTGGAPRMVVLQSLRPQTRNDNPYLKQLLRAIEPHADIEYFSWRTALVGRFDVFHVHWPEFLLREQGRNRFVQYLLFSAFLLRMRLTGKRVVRTLHNLEPHEGVDAIERRLLEQLDRSTSTWIRINETTPLRAPHTATILHGHYRDWFAELSVPASVPGRLLYFGLIRPYKGVEGLLDCFESGPEAAAPVTLRIVGKPATDALRQRIETACAANAQVTALLDYVDDATLAHEIGQAQLVVLPFRQMHNSGSLVLALSLNRPVLVPRNEANTVLAAEVGPGWIYMYDGELRPDVLAAALERVARDERAAAPDLSRREWAEAGVSHCQAYAAALAAPTEARA